MMNIKTYMNLVESLVESANELPLYSGHWGNEYRSRVQGLSKVAFEGFTEAQKRIEELEQENIDLRDREGVEMSGLESTLKETVSYAKENLRDWNEAREEILKKEDTEFRDLDYVTVRTAREAEECALALDFIIGLLERGAGKRIEELEQENMDLRDLVDTLGDGE